MAGNGIPEEVKVFLANNIDSILELEILLLLRADAQRAWTAADLAKELKIDPAWAEEQLIRFSARGVLWRTDQSPIQFRYAPAEALDATIARVAEAYVSHRVSIIGLIFSKPTSNLKTFADAFRIRKDKNDG